MKADTPNAGTTSHDRTLPSAFVAPGPLWCVAAAGRRRRRVEAAALEPSRRRHIRECFVRERQLEADLGRPGAVGDGIGVAVDRTGNRQIRRIEAVAAPRVVDVLPLVRVAHTGRGREPGRQSDGRLSEDRAAGRVDARVEPNLGAGDRLIEPDSLVIGFVEKKDAPDQVQPGPLVRDRDLLRQLMLPLVLARRQHVEFCDIAIVEEFVVQVSIRGQADEAGGWGEGRRQTRAGAVMPRAIPSLRRRSHVVEVGRVVELKARLLGQHLAVGQWRPILGVDVGSTATDSSGGRRPRAVDPVPR